MVVEEGAADCYRPCDCVGIGHEIASLRCDSTAIDSEAFWSKRASVLSMEVYSGLILSSLQSYPISLACIDGASVRIA